MSTLAAAAGCQAVFHAAAAIGVGGQWEAFEAPNVTGTRHIMEATEAAGARLVHVSSTAVFGSHRYRSTPTDEDVPLPRLPADDLYGRSKQDAERAVLAAHAAGRIWAAAVRPPLMYGRRDRQFVPRLAPLLERGVFPLVEDGATVLSLVHADSVADGAVRAVDTASAGGGRFSPHQRLRRNAHRPCALRRRGPRTTDSHARNSARACNRGGTNGVAGTPMRRAQRPGPPRAGSVGHADTRQSVHVGACPTGARVGSPGATLGRDTRGIRMVGQATSVRPRAPIS